MRLVSLLLALLFVVAMTTVSVAQDSASPAAATTGLIQPVADAPELSQAPVAMAPVGYALVQPVFLGAPRYTPVTPAQPVIYERQYRTPLRNAMFGKYHWGLMPQGTTAPVTGMPPTTQFLLLQ
jgi:hypothetical protein